ncbi:MAG: hydratase, partial [Clostridia bacterium]|nr:hydratase [Clostridia bacterium]
IWITDEKTREYFKIHGRDEDYKELKPGNGALYDRMIEVDLSMMKPMIALPFHPSNTYTMREFIDNASDILSEIEKEADRMATGMDFRLTDKVRDKNVLIDQGIIAGCAGGTYENILSAASILKGKSTGTGDFSLSVYPQSQPVYFALNNTDAINTLMTSGAVIKTAFCGPCFGAGDVPSNNGFSIRHTTRNFPSREGSKPGDGQMAGVALMDAKSIAATASRGGILTPADEIDYIEKKEDYSFNGEIYKNRVYQGFGKKDDTVELKYGPNIKDWPEFDGLLDNLLLLVASVIDDEVTTTDELIPSGETSSYRSDPMKLAEFTLSRKDPGYVARAKEALDFDKKRKKGELGLFHGISLSNTMVGSLIYANKPGDGSAREQAASCQKVLGGQANAAIEYATKRYRSNLVNWGMLPFVVKEKPDISTGDYIYIEGIRDAVREGRESVMAKNITNGNELELLLPAMTEDERQIILDGCLINYYRNHGKV